MTRNVPRDPVTGTSAERSAPRKPISGMSSPEIEEEIRRTRALMTDTLNEIEQRVSPARIKHEIRETFNDTVDGVREQYHPKILAKRAGDNMLDTVRDNPVPALIAGLSIGYMFMKGRDDDHGDRRPYRADGRRYRARDQWDYRFEEDLYRDQLYPSRHSEFANYPEYPEQYSSEDEGSRTRERAEHLKEQASDTAHRVREGVDDARRRADETMHEARRRADQAMHEAQDRARRASRNIRRSASRAEHTIEDFVQENPLMAGLIAAGVGAFLGSLLPSTQFEDRRLGGIRDEVMDEASELAREAKERARHVADDAKDELKESGRHVAESAKSEFRQMGDSSGAGASEFGSSGMASSGQTPADRTSPERTTSEPPKTEPTTSERTTSERTSPTRTASERTSTERTSPDRTPSEGTSRDGGKVTGEGNKAW